MTLASTIAAIPEDDIVAAIKDPTNLGTVSLVVRDIISVALPGIDGAVLSALVALYVEWVYSSGGGTISADPNPEKNAQTTQSRGGRNP